MGNLAYSLHLARAMHRGGSCALWAIACLVGCAAGEPGEVAGSIAAAAAEANVPADLMLAIAIEEGGVKLPQLRLVRDDDHVPVAGALELRHGKLDTLALGARLMGTTEAALRGDTNLGTRAGARVLAWLGATDDIATWRPALELLSGMDDANAHAYADRVLAILRDGGDFRARGAERLRVTPRPLPRGTSIAAAEPPTPDFPGAMWFTTSCANKCDVGRPLGNAKVDKIVIHDTEGGWDGSVATLQHDGGKSVHYIIDADGSRVGQFRPETDTTWHAGNYYYNETSIGIEHVGVAADPAGYSAELYATSRALVTNIRTRWTVPLDRTHIVGHYQIPDGNVLALSAAPCTDTLDTCETSSKYGGSENHRDPGYHWQWCQYMEALGGSCTCNDAWPMWNCTTDGAEAVRCVNGTVEIAKCMGGCDVMPVGTEDVCHTDAIPPDAGVPDGGPENSEQPPQQPGGGCSTTTGSGGLLLVGLLIGLVRGVQRRRA